MTNNYSRPIVLITGGAGFIGSHTADALISAGFRVRILDCLDPQVHGNSGVFPSYLHPEIDCINGDVRSAEDVRHVLDGVSIVYHFAALTGVGQSMYDIKNYVDNNVTGTANLLEVIIKNKFPIKKIILSSSRAVYGEGTHACPVCGVFYPVVRSLEDLNNNRFEVYCPNCGRPSKSVSTKEDRPLLPTSIYGWTKKLQEELFLQASSNFGLNTTILRYFNVFGSRQSLQNPYTGIVSIFYSRMKAGSSISIYEHGSPLRDFIHVFDIVQANLQILKKDIFPGSTFNIGSGVEYSVLNIADALSRAMQIKLEFEDKGEFRIGDIHACIADITKAKNDLDYQPKISLDEGIGEFVLWAQTNPSADLTPAAVRELKSFGLLQQSKAAE